MDKGSRTSPAEGKPNKQGFSRLFSAALLCAGLSTLLPGCSLLRAPQTVVTSVIPGTKSKGPEPLKLQIEVQRFADEFNGRTITAIDEYVRSVGTPSAQLEGLRWKLQAASAIVGIASGALPKANLMDLVTLTTLTRMGLEDRIPTLTNAVDAAQDWLRVTISLETNVWKLAATELDPPQIKELHDAIDAWHARNPEVRTAFFARPPEFAAMAKDSSESGSQVSSVFSLVNLDPTAGLDPAVREITMTRLFAERAMFTAQRMPFLLRMQAELLTAQLTRQPEVQAVLTNTAQLADSVDRASRAAETISQTAAQLPDRISTERKEILAALGQQEGQLRELAVTVDNSLVHAGKMSDSLSITITNFDALMKRFGVGEPKTKSAPTTNSPPFNILDYGKTAAQIGEMAREVSTLIASVNQSVPQVAVLGQHATADAGRLMDRAFWLGLALILVLLVGCVMAALAYRILAAKLVHRERQSSSNNPP